MSPDEEAVRQPVPVAISQVVSPDETVARIAELQAFVRHYLVEGVDYGKIPGTDKPTLLKPGAEKLCDVYGLTPRYTIDSYTESDGDPPFYSWIIRCTLYWRRGDLLVAEGLGEANSWENRYRWRWVPAGEVPGGETTGLRTRKTRSGATLYRVPNDDVWSLRNTILKQAKKRALVDAVLTATRSSGVLTQDLEDLDDATVVDVDGEPAASPPRSAAEPAKAAPPNTKGTRRPADEARNPAAEARREFTRAYERAVHAGCTPPIISQILGPLAAGRHPKEWNSAQLVQAANILIAAGKAMERGVTADGLAALWTTLYAKDPGPWTPERTAQLVEDLNSLDPTASQREEGNDDADLDTLPDPLPF